jgi:hypothetical protein
MKIHIVFFQFTTSFSLVGRHHRFGVTYCLHLHCRILISEEGSVTTQEIQSSLTLRKYPNSFYMNWSKSGKQAEDHVFGRTFIHGTFRIRNTNGSYTQTPIQRRPFLMPWKAANRNSASYHQFTVTLVAPRIAANIQWRYTAVLVYLHRCLRFQIHNPSKDSRFYTGYMQVTRKQQSKQVRWRQLTHEKAYILMKQYLQNGSHSCKLPVPSGRPHSATDTLFL